MRHFDSWFNETKEAKDYEQTKVGWEACKEEVLKLLETKIKYYNISKLGVQNWILEIKEL